MKKLTVTFERDEPASAQTTLLVPQNTSVEGMIRAAKDFAQTSIEDLEFESSHDWSEGLRIASIDTPERAGVVREIPIESNPNDLGAALQAVFAGRAGLNALLDEADRQDQPVKPGVRNLLELSDALQQAGQLPQDFAPFKLVTESQLIDEDFDGEVPAYVEIKLRPDLLRHLSMLAEMGQKMQVEHLTISDPTIRWGSSSVSLTPDDSELSIYPGDELTGDPATFVLSAHGLCESGFISLPALRDIALGGPIPEGFHRTPDVADVIFQAGQDPEDVIQSWKNDQQSESPDRTDGDDPF